MKKKRIGMAILAIAIATFALAASTPAMAVCICDVETTTNTCNHGTNGTVNGTIYVDGDGENELGQNYVHVDFEDIPAGVSIKWARVYWHIWMPGVWTDATFCNATQCWENNQSICDPSDASCTCEQDEYDGFYGGGCGTTWVYWNVTNNVSSSEQHNITIDNRAPGADGRTMWVYLVAVLENSTTYSEMHYWVNQGYEDLEANNISTTWFNGPVTTGRNGTLWHLALTAGESEGVWFNGHKMRDGIPRNNVTKEEIPGGWIENDGTQNMTWNNTGPNADNWLHPVMAVFMDNVTRTESGEDLIVEDSEFPTVMRPNKNHKIHATIKNQGSESTGVGFNVSLYVDNVEKDTTTVAALGAGNSIDVNFTVNLSAGCHTFTVVADSDGDVSEVEEANNASSEKYQVGYVVVVKSDSDFEKLNTSGDYALPTGCFKNESGTYYLQNLNGSLSIENCVGNGITIENTNAKFVIKNCTIRNCKDSGVFFHNLSNGTVNGSVMQNNTKYGIELGVVPLSAEDPKLVTITNNTILENKLCGIELIGCNFTVRNNTVRNNTQQGIYLLANHSEIYNNTIKYNDDYGVKLYNSFGNYVYKNHFTDNKASNPGHQAWDNGATNNNHWNTTAKGNWWSDWKLNSGYFDSPRVYKIDGDSNKDYKPEGPPEENYTYDFNSGAGNNKWAFKYQVSETPMPPDTNSAPGTPLTTEEYSLIGTDNGDFLNNTAITNNHAAHRFNFSISEDQNDIIKINVTWNGIGIRSNNFHGAKLYIWNFTSGEYGTELASTDSSDEVNLTGAKTGTCCSDYIDSSSNMTVLVVQNRHSAPNQKSTIKTDYVNVIITT